MMAHSYAHLYGMPCTGLRFFTVYGPWGRPDMALFLFTKAILAGEPIKVFNHGHHKRSFTYVDDIVEGVIRTLDQPPAKNADWNGAAPDPATSGVAPYRLYNIGNEQPVELLRYIEVLEQCLGRKAQMEMLPLQARLAARNVLTTAGPVTGRVGGDLTGRSGRSGRRARSGSRCLGRRRGGGG